MSTHLRNLICAVLIIPTLSVVAKAATEDPPSDEFNTYSCNVPYIRSGARDGKIPADLNKEGFWTNVIGDNDSVYTADGKPNQAFIDTMAELKCVHQHAIKKVRCSNSYPCNFLKEFTVISNASDPKNNFTGDKVGFGNGVILLYNKDGNSNWNKEAMEGFLQSNFSNPEWQQPPPTADKAIYKKGGKDGNQAYVYFHDQIATTRRPVIPVVPAPAPEQPVVPIPVTHVSDTPPLDLTQNFDGDCNILDQYLHHAADKPECKIFRNCWDKILAKTCRRNEDNGCGLAGCIDSYTKYSNDGRSQKGNVSTAPNASDSEILENTKKADLAVTALITLKNKIDATKWQSFSSCFFYRTRMLETNAGAQNSQANYDKHHTGPNDSCVGSDGGKVSQNLDVLLDDLKHYSSTGNNKSEPNLLVVKNMGAALNDLINGDREKFYADYLKDAGPEAKKAYDNFVTMISRLAENDGAGKSFFEYAYTSKGTHMVTGKRLPMDVSPEAIIDARGASCLITDYKTSKQQDQWDYNDKIIKDFEYAKTLKKGLDAKCGSDTGTNTGAGRSRQ